ncbi:hypothetical protein D4764_18G0012780 [Takifugu flavidus]|uniref:Uncharacterized protein n=1 Tax=Takifugu flavidus TaxID=433684 RepID=A0A5C6NSH8_9TELE|nr:hypothetical protein D4764_18G0012780 [Takifugu flavidus]
MEVLIGSTVSPAPEHLSPGSPAILCSKCLSANSIIFILTLIILIAAPSPVQQTTAAFSPAGPRQRAVP